VRLTPSVPVTAHVGHDPNLVKDFYLYVFTKLENWSDEQAGEILCISGPNDGLLTLPEEVDEEEDSYDSESAFESESSEFDSDYSGGEVYDEPDQEFYDAEDELVHDSAVFVVGLNRQTAVVGTAAAVGVALLWVSLQYVRSILFG